jgi:Leucine-rich repeat (LRR) protein
MVRYGNMEWPRSLPDTLWQCPQLRTLKIKDDAVTELPNSIPVTAKLQSLKLDIQNLTCLPDAIGRLTDLTNLEIECSHVARLPNSISQLSSLLILKMDHAFVGRAVLRDGLTALEHLALVEHSDDHRHDLGSLARFTNLQSLHISDVGSDSIQFGAHIRLTSLRISHCLDLVELPASLGNLGQLRELVLDHI